ncbi:RmlC-like cupin domain-containing protein [Mariannaea sp. PMI_226]|nr:RmlC-like cupin domain-containing protein [Mariannaea sp. PMI_226]
MCLTSEEPVFVDVSQVETTASEGFQEPSRGNTTWHTLLSAPNTSTNAFCGGVAVCPRYGTLALHRHKQAEIYYILSGSGEVEVDGKRTRVSKDMVVWIPGDAEHGVFTGDEELKWFYVFPEGSFESVIYRFTHEQKV